MIFFISVISIFFSLLLLSKVIKSAYNNNIFDNHDERKIHKGNIPRVGGIAFVPSAVISFMFALIILYLRDEAFDLGIHHTFIQDSVIILISILIIYVFGVYDDLKGLRYRNKFTYQFSTGLMLCLAGIYMKDIHGILALYHIPPIFGCFVSIFVMVLSINAINFIDGIDGLSSGIAIIAFIYYSIILIIERNDFWLLSISFLCAILPFFFFNVFGSRKNKTKSFMGDAGSTVLGLVIFLLAVIVNENPNTELLYDNPLVLAYAPLLLPFYDVISVVYQRLLNAKNIFKADDNHFHHKLLKLGFSQPMALLIELLVVVFVIFSTLILVKYININVVVGSSLLLWIWINLLLTKIIKAKKAN